MPTTISESGSLYRTEYLLNINTLPLKVLVFPTNRLGLLQCVKLSEHIVERTQRRDEMCFFPFRFQFVVLSSCDLALRDNCRNVRESESRAAAVFTPCVRMSKSERLDPNANNISTED